MTDSSLAPPTVSPGDELILEPHGLTIDGKAVARMGESGPVVFLDHALPGQRVRAEVTALKKRFLTARTLEVLEKSPGQIEPFCPHFNECGGCDWQDLAYAEQLTWKRRLIEDSLTRIGRLNAPQIPPVLPSPRALHYRNKMEFAFGSAADERPRLGLRRRASHDIVEIAQCNAMAAPPEFTARLLAAARRLAEESGLPAWPLETKSGKHNGFWRFLVLRSVEARPEHDLPAQLHVQLITAPQPRAEEAGLRFLRGLMEELPEITGACHSLRAAPGQVAYGERRLSELGANTLEERIGAVRLRLDPDAFFQTNSAATESLYAEIRRMACPLSQASGSQSVWDLYSGVGGIALFLADQAREVLGFEISTAACAAAEANCRLNGMDNCKFHSGDVLKSLPAAKGRPDLLIADPPRAGLHPGVTREILRVRPPRLIHVGCDVASQARDVKNLCEGGYRFVEAAGVDMFPHAAHVENIVLLAAE